MKDLAKENLRLSYENRLLKNKLARIQREYLELAGFAQEREAVNSDKTRERVDQALPPAIDS